MKKTEGKRSKSTGVLDMVFRISNKMLVLGHSTFTFCLFS